MKSHKKTITMLLTAAVLLTAVFYDRMHQTVGTSGSSLLAVQEAAHLVDEVYQKLLTGEARELLDSTVDDAWKDGFEKSLLENYGVTPDHYEDLGNGVYQVYVEIDGKVVPYVAVDSATGGYHG